MHNRAHGWQGAPEQIVHTSAQVGMYDTAEAMKWKPYHQCLTILPRILSCTSALPSRQLVAYYKLLLRGVHVEAGLANKEYMVLLNRHKRGRGEELEPIPLEDGPEGNNDGIIVPARKKASKTANPRPPPSQRPVGGPIGPGSSGDPIPLPAPPTPRAAVPPEPTHLEESAAPDGIIGTTSTPPPDGIVVGPRQSRPAGAERLSPEWVAGLDGCFVAFRDYLNPLTGKQYANWKLC